MTVEGAPDDAPSRFIRVTTERMDDAIAGLRYGTSPRILMRSSSHILYVALGVHVVPRGARAMHHVTTVARRASRIALSKPTARRLITETFGDGSDDAAIAALGARGDGTVLVDGGGKPVVRAHDVARAVRTAYDAVSPEARDLLPVTGTCRQCGGALTPVLNSHHFDTVPVDGQPRAIDECRRITNHPVMSVHGYGLTRPETWWPYVSWFTTWDGESYRDPLFCSDTCAGTYGRRAATELPPLEINGDAPARQQSGEHVNHAAREDRITVDGLRI